MEIKYFIAELEYVSQIKTNNERLFFFFTHITEQRTTFERRAGAVFSKLYSPYNSEYY